ncbi:hypothetical protein [uncultured Ilyobacter sp.]|uniref:hypothetical protein n=1 Tax=uncultured Ilyobacter sp. TaxID=544433 RepID=UPI0029C69FD5|nr:hypothetical protein [uncultured Ilyobacter sp.]
MKDIKDKFEDLKDKAEGEIKENLGKATGDQELELEGKIKKKILEVNLLFLLRKRGIGDFILIDSERQKYM